ncbi:MAG TPA: DUF2155 domain-containing protein [Caulobacteraceae bacterium]|jgi:hypothetical protein|nr:DUF2155 domain-containing protein [Caulobacteraceae bacterium]
MARRRTGLMVGGLAICLAAAGATWGQVQPPSDPIDQALQSSAAPAKPTPTKLKPREDTAGGIDKSGTGVAASTAAAPSGDDEDNPEVDSGGPSPSSAAAKPPEPMKRPRYAVAVMQALDKVTAETVRFEAPVNQPVRYKTLVFTVHACETTAPDEAGSDAVAHVEIDSQPKGPEGAAPPPTRQVFKGWMFASSPGLNLFQHPIYDAWLIACKTATPAA